MTDCPHPRERVDVYVQRAGLNRYTYYRCMRCGEEWTEATTVADLSDGAAERGRCCWRLDTVTSDEVLAVHEALQQGDWWLT